MNTNVRTIMPALLATCLLVSGCLLQDNTHTLYLDPDGSVTWSILQRDVRSDCETPEKRKAEELRYLDAIRSGSGPMALALDRLNGRRVRTTLLRDDRPFTALTEARFSSARRLAQDLLAGFELDGKVDLSREGDGMRLTITIDTDSSSDIDEDDPLVALLDDIDRYRVVLTRGRFVDAEGFDIDGSKAIATLAHGESVEDKLTLSLAWVHE